MLLDAKFNKVLLPGEVVLNVSPRNSGIIRCDGKEITTNLPDLLPFNSRCTAEASQGFEFIDWIQNVGQNATRTINSSSNSGTVLDFLFKPTDKASVLTLTYPGSFTVNFKEIPSPIPKEYLIGLASIAATTLVGWSIPSIISWTNSKRRAKVVFAYHQKIGSLGTMDQVDMTSLDQLYTDLGNDYSKARITDKQYENMKNEISALYQEIYRKRIESSSQISDKATTKLNNLVVEIEDTYAKGKLSEVHYTMLNGKIAQYKNNRNVSSE